MERTHRGSGSIISDGNEFPVEYEIRETQTTRAISSSGFVTGLSIGDNYALLTSGAKTLRLETGEIVDIILIGGDATAARSQIHVNGPMPETF